jgi:hypothetical protein
MLYFITEFPASYSKLLTKDRASFPNRTIRFWVWASPSAKSIGEWAFTCASLTEAQTGSNWQTKKPLADNDKNNGDNLDIQIQTVKKSRRIRTARCLYLGYFIWRPQHMCHIVPDLRRHKLCVGRKISSGRPDVDKIFQMLQFLIVSVPGGLLEECSWLLEIFTLLLKGSPSAELRYSWKLIFSTNWYSGSRSQSLDATFL